MNYTQQTYVVGTLIKRKSQLLADIKTVETYRKTLPQWQATIEFYEAEIDMIDSIIKSISSKQGEYFAITRKFEVQPILDPSDGK